MHIPKDKMDLMEEMKNIVAVKQLKEESNENPDNNIISRILNDISYFAGEILGDSFEVVPSLHLVNMKSKTLYENEYSQRGPFYDPAFETIYMTLSSGRYSFQHLSDLELSFILAHEYSHFLEGKCSTLLKNKDKCINDIVSESLADYFAGWYLQRCMDENEAKKESDSKNIEKFIGGLSCSLESYSLEYNEKIFYLINDDEHGSIEHRLAMYKKGFKEGNIDYYLNCNNFIPEEIVKLKHIKKNTD